MIGEGRGDSWPARRGKRREKMREEKGVSGVRVEGKKKKVNRFDSISQI